MATSYTYSVTEETTLRDFMLRCSRAFEACIDMRDESLDTPPPKKIEPDPSWKKRVAEARTRLEQVSSMSEKEHLDLARHRWIVSEQEKSEEVCRKENKKYLKLKSAVLDWECPNTLIGLKNFMLEQLDLSIRIPLRRKPSPAPRSGKNVKKNEIKYAEEALKRAESDLEMVLKKVSEANDWLSDLYSEAEYCKK
jgi:hypothetical protein